MRPQRSSVAGLILAVLLASGTAAEDGSIVDRLTEAAIDFLAGLDAKQRDTVLYFFNDEERLDFRMVPVFLDGLAMSDMGVDQRERLRRLLAGGLSPRGLAKVEAIMSLEREVERLERESWSFRYFQSFLRDPYGYTVTVYGLPTVRQPWAFRFDGHHVSLNFTVAPDEIPASTPLFLGAHPRRVPEGWERGGLRVLAAEEDRGRSLYRSLEEAQKKIARIPLTERSVFGAEEDRAAATRPIGVPWGAMNADQKQLLNLLLETYLANFPRELADARRREIHSAGKSSIHFAWAGESVEGKPSYYRLQGPTFSIEFDNTLPAADHVHVVWRDAENDFGEDLLAKHYGESHQGSEVAFRSSTRKRQRTSWRRDVSMFPVSKLTRRSGAASPSK